jgi:predicted N-acyltransferase
VTRAATVTPRRPLKLEAFPDSRWDAFVRAHPRASVYHLSAWLQILSRAYGHKPACLMTEDGEGQVTGVFPIVQMRGLISGRRLNSLPLEGVAGPLGQTASHERALIEAAVALVHDRGARRLDFRSTTAGHAQQVPAIVAGHQAPSWMIELPADSAALRGSWDKETRRQLRRAEGAGLKAREATSTRDLQRFHRLYLETMRRHLAAPRSYRQLALSRALLQPAGVFKLFVVEREGKLLAGGVYHAFGQTMEAVYGASDRRQLSLHPNHLLEWHAIRWAIEHGLRRFDLGGARSESVARFKRQWGAKPVEIFRYFYAAHPRAEAVETLNRIQRAAQTSDADAIRRAWRALPVRVTGLAGALAHRYL